MLCDEVGLGKTIEAGMALRQLVVSGVAKRVLILVPKSVLVQWQEELYEKFALNIPRYDGSAFWDVFGRRVESKGEGEQGRKGEREIAAESLLPAAPFPMPPPFFPFRLSPLLPPTLGTLTRSSSPRAIWRSGEIGKHRSWKPRIGT